MYSATKGDVNLLNSILKHHPDVNAKDSKNRNALFYAMMSNNGDNPELVNALLNAGINPNDTEYYIPTENIEGHSPLTLAAKFNYKNIMKALLEKKANPNHQVSSNYNSCLHYAIINNNEEMVNILIEARANINILNRDDITPINMALKGSNGIIYWKLAHENERLQVENEVFKMKNDSENIDLHICNIDGLETISSPKGDRSNNDIKRHKNNDVSIEENSFYTENLNINTKNSQTNKLKEEIEHNLTNINKIENYKIKDVANKECNVKINDEIYATPNNPNLKNNDINIINTEKSNMKKNLKSKEKNDSKTFFIF